MFSRVQSSRFSIFRSRFDQRATCIYVERGRDRERYIERKDKRARETERDVRVCVCVLLRRSDRCPSGTTLIYSGPLSYLLEHDRVMSGLSWKKVDCSIWAHIHAYIHKYVHA